MTHFRRVVLVVLAMVLFAVPAHAQDNGSIPGLEELEGLETAVARAYVFDFSAMDTGNTPAEGGRSILVFAGWVIEFDSSDSASAGFDSLVDTAGAEAMAMLAADGAEVTPVAVDDLGEKATTWGAAGDDASSPGYARYLMMQEGAYVFLIMIVAESEATAMDTEVLAAHFSDQVAEGHTGIGEMVSEGSYTGGLWAFFPAGDDPLYAGLIQDEDVVVFPANAA